MSAISVTKETFHKEVMMSEKPVLVDFWAPWCGPCRMVAPIVEEIARERADIKVGKVNVDEQPELASQFGVMSIPTLVVMKDGKIVHPVRGASLIGRGSEILTRIDRVGKDMKMAQGMCGSLSGSVPTNVGQPMIRVSSITVGGR